MASSTEATVAAAMTATTTSTENKQQCYNIKSVCKNRTFEVPPTPSMKEDAVSDQTLSAGHLETNPSSGKPIKALQT